MVIWCSTCKQSPAVSIMKNLRQLYWVDNTCGVAPKLKKPDILVEKWWGFQKVKSLRICLAISVHLMLKNIMTLKCS